MTSSTPTLRDVAAEAGVSPMTASNALRGKPGVKESTRAKVIAAAKKLNYRINLTASMLKSGRSNIIHVIVNEFDSPFYSKLTQALSNEIVSRGLIPFIEQTQYSPDAAEHALSSNPFSGSCSMARSCTPQAWAQMCRCPNSMAADHSCCWTPARRRRPSMP